MRTLQIDVIDEHSGVYKCNLYTGDRCVTIYMYHADYTQLVNDGFFIRDGKTKDSANVLNTTNEFKEQRNDPKRSI